MATENTAATPVSYLDMSDEQMLEAGAPSGYVMEDTSEEEHTTEGENGADDNDDNDDATASESDTDGESSAESTDADTDGDSNSDLEHDGVDTTDSEKSAKLPEGADTKEGTTDAVDYAAEYARLMAPFKANGKDVQVENVDDAIALMQMGANYNKKMAALKPNLKLLKLLEKNGMLSEDKISFLIDVQNKDPGAINKLIKDSGIDPMDIDADKAGEYKQSTYTVDDREVDLDTVLDELSGSEAYTRTLNIVGNKWDSASKGIVAEHPQLLKVINDHVQRGIYDLISTEVERERMLGRLNGLSDIEAYRQVGDVMEAKGKFNHLNKGSSQVQQKQAQPPKTFVPKAKTQESEDLKNKRRAASSTQANSGAKAEPDYNPLGISDDEFEKLTNPKYL